MTNLNEQNEHPLYRDAHDRFLRAEAEQNIKAAAKYPEPLNPASWTAEQLGDHFAQESVDQGRYVEALVAKCKALEDELEITARQRNTYHDATYQALNVLARVWRELGITSVSVLEDLIDDETAEINGMIYMRGADAS